MGFKQLRLALVNTRPLDGSAALATQALDLMAEAGELMREELKDPGLSLDYVVRMKRAAESCGRHARSYALEAERQFGRCLLGLPPEGDEG